MRSATVVLLILTGSVAHAGGAAPEPWAGSGKTTGTYSGVVRSRMQLWRIPFWKHKFADRYNLRVERDGDRLSLAILDRSAQVVKHLKHGQIVSSSTEADGGVRLQARFEGQPHEDALHGVRNLPVRSAVSEVALVFRPYGTLVLDQTDRLERDRLRAPHQNLTIRKTVTSEAHGVFLPGTIKQRDPSFGDGVAEPR